MDIFSKLSLFKNKKSSRTVMAAKIDNFDDRKCISTNLEDTQLIDYHQLVEGDILIFCSTGFRVLNEVAFFNLYEPTTKEIII